ncbi:hypothetical protein QA584_10470 [Anaerocolumna sp. AGMB13025]|uniref:hypothetical protein n=1 Tax=Anaerocolumna sp. AGMB13025 TaxID=3039116 RepID=UPI00241D6255|nr:hypothetical protein [Anaerocolumna sp. AGMB13025]WFR59486.1 hypothetical protein QA584_10470 [Anaerocolumna sp. AGMB13025]
MKIEFIPAYLKLEDYIQEEFHNPETWEKTMVEPYWSLISQWSTLPEDYKKPICHLNKNEAIQQLELLKRVDWDKVMESFNMICDALPKDDDDMMYVAIYPSNTREWLRKFIFCFCDLLFSYHHMDLLLGEVTVMIKILSFHSYF